MMKSRFKFGEIVLINFPFVDGISSKMRPALIINDFNDGDIVVCRITSQLYNTKYDFKIENWISAGLKLPSVIRVHKIVTLDKSMVAKILGNIDASLKQRVTQIISDLTS